MAGAFLGDMINFELPDTTPSKDRSVQPYTTSWKDVPTNKLVESPDTADGRIYDNTVIPDLRIDLKILDSGLLQ